MNAHFAIFTVLLVIIAIVTVGFIFWCSWLSEKLGKLEAMMLSKAPYESLESERTYRRGVEERLSALYDHLGVMSVVVDRHTQVVKAPKTKRTF